MLASPGGLSTFLSTFNYTLYLLAHLDAKAAPLKAKLYLFLNRNATIPKITPAVPAETSAIQNLGGMVSSARTTLRLFGLFPMYAWARQLAQGPKPGQDQVLYATAVAQCALYTVFQFCENVALLTESKVLPASLTERWTSKYGGKATSIYLTAYRAWLMGFSCDFIRLLREAQLERNKRAQRTSAQKYDLSTRDQDSKTDAKWYSELIIPFAWFPMGWHFAALNEGGFPGFNLGVMGLSGLVASWSKAVALWESTADV